MAERVGWVSYFSWVVFFFFSVEGVNAENGAKANLGRGFEAFASGGR